MAIAPIEDVTHEIRAGMRRYSADGELLEMREHEVQALRAEVARLREEIARLRDRLEWAEMERRGN